MSSQELDISRHRELFNPETFDAPIHVIGCGATGSWVVLQLAKLGLKDITVWDFDHVEEHNIPNQAFGIDDVELKKVTALALMIKELTGTVIQVKCERVTNQRLSGVVFMMVDTMSGRKEIWENCIKLKSRVLHLIEPRMGLDMGRIYNVSPCDLHHIKQYEDTYYGDDVAEVSACGNSMTVITSALAVAATCVRQLINYADGTELDNEILVDFKYNNLVPTSWKVKVETPVENAIQRIWDDAIPAEREVVGNTPFEARAATTFAARAQQINETLAAGGALPITHIAEPPVVFTNYGEQPTMEDATSHTIDDDAVVDRYVTIMRSNIPNELREKLNAADTIEEALELHDSYFENVDANIDAAREEEQLQNAGEDYIAIDFSN